MIKTGASITRARAIDRRWASPPDSSQSGADDAVVAFGKGDMMTSVDLKGLGGSNAPSRLACGFEGYIALMLVLSSMASCSTKDTF